MSRSEISSGTFGATIGSTGLLSTRTMTLAGGLADVGAERGPAGDQFVQRRREPVDVAGRCGRAALEQFRRGVRGEVVQRRAVGRRVDPDGFVEAGEHRLARVGDQHGARPHVAVQDARPVHGLERAGELDADRDHVAQPHRLDAVQELEQRARAAFEDERGPPVRQLDLLMTGDDVRVRAHGGEDAALVDQHVALPRGARLVRQLDSHDAAGAAVASLEQIETVADAAAVHIGEPVAEFGAGECVPRRDRHRSPPALAGQSSSRLLHMGRACGARRR